MILTIQKTQESKDNHRNKIIMRVAAPRFERNFNVRSSLIIIIVQANMKRISKNNSNFLI